MTIALSLPPGNRFTNMIILSNIESRHGLPPFGPAFPNEPVIYIVNEEVKNRIFISTKRASVI